VELLETGRLSKVWTLARHLKVEPLLDKIFLGSRGVDQGVFLVVNLDEILDDSNRLSESNTSVRVFSGCNSAVDIYLFKRLLLQVSHICKIVSQYPGWEKFSLHVPISF
jgi:hypothetical protein